MKKLINYFDLLMQNNTGKSSKSFALVMAVVVGSLAIISFLVMLFVDLFSTYEINTDLVGLAGIITALGGLITAIFWGKVRSERRDSFNQPHDTNYFPES